ncbi:Peroxisomal coenzyme A diphosphatase 1, peroxisomal [Tolypocladium paradoxum]|uniref:Peroxisomal coenzyme A diphosphatase 1, peroxisomal n=1 Tax=Tolypocladium paradoxum TaxID=94208 RepID=A0A2S4KL57_9HYPO|nr:Peroxisomal coenzyme A diphosphatase 1, peroxisomal [Tolypocladium paradoxum]
MESPSPSQGGPGSPSRLPLDTPSPALVERYSHKPLPPLPPTSPPGPRASRSSRASTERRDRISGPRAATAAGSEPSTPIHVGTLSSPRSHARRISYSGLSATGRRSSHKVQQLTGYDIDVMDDCPILYGSVDSDASSNYSQKWDGEPGPVPWLENDNGDTSSRGSSWMPMSPRSALIPPPLNICKLAIRDSNDSNLGGSFCPEADVDLDEESAQSWEPAYQHSSDSMASDEYHRISAQLATQPTRQTTADGSTSPAPAGRKSSSLGLSFSAGSRFARWRSMPPRAIDFAMPPLALPLALPLLATGSHRQKKAACPPDEPLASQHSVKAVPVSAFDSDSDGEEGSHGIKEWFGRRSDEHAASDREPAARATHGEQMRELLHHARDRAKMLHMPKEERRREELRRHIKPSRWGNWQRGSAEAPTQASASHADRSATATSTSLPPSAEYQKMTATLSPAPDESSNRRSASVSTASETTATTPLDDVCIAEGDVVAHLRAGLGRASPVREWQVDDDYDDYDAEEGEEGESQASLYYDESTMASLNPFSVVRCSAWHALPIHLGLAHSLAQAAINRLRAYKPPAFPLWDALPARKRAAVLVLLYADRWGDLRVVITMRAASLRSFSGHAALPGGKADSKDETPYQIARREAYEEIGLPMDDARIPRPFRIEPLCTLPPSLARTHLVVTPCVAFLHADRTASPDDATPLVEESMVPRLDAREVAAVFSAPLYNFLKAADLPPRPGQALPPGPWYDGAWMTWKDMPWRVHNFYVPVNNQRVSKPRRDSAQGNLAQKLDEERQSEGRFKVWGMTGRLLVDAARIAYGEDPEMEHNATYGDYDIIQRAEEEGAFEEVGEGSKDDGNNNNGSNGSAKM